MWLIIYRYNCVWSARSWPFGKFFSEKKVASCPFVHVACLASIRLRENSTFSNKRGFVLCHTWGTVWKRVAVRLWWAFWHALSVLNVRRFDTSAVLAMAITHTLERMESYRHIIVLKFTVGWRSLPMQVVHACKSC